MTREEYELKMQSVKSLNGAVKYMYEYIDSLEQRNTELEQRVKELEDEIKELELLSNTGINGTCQDATLALKQIRSMSRGY